MRAKEAYLSVEKGIYRVTRWANGLGVCFLVAMMVFMTVDIALRNIADIVIWGVFEIVELMCGIFVSFALAYCASQRGHIRITLVLSRLPRMVQRVTNSITAVISIVVVALLAWQAWEQGFDIERSGAETVTWFIPIYPFYFVLFVGFVLFALVWIVQLREHFSGETVNE